MKIFVFISMFFFLSGCATTYRSADDLVNNPKTFKRTFIAPMNYQKAYRILAEMSRKCLQISSMGNERRTEEKLDTQRNVGEISFINHNAFWGEDYFGYYVVKPSPQDKNKTELTSYHQNNTMGSMNDNSKLLQSWLEGNTSCFQR